MLNGVTATVTDVKNYMSESAHGVIRKARVHRFSAYRRMYRSMCEAIVGGADGDSLQSLGQSSYTVLAAEAATITDAENRFEGQFHRGFFRRLALLGLLARRGFSRSHGRRSS